MLNKQFLQIVSEQRYRSSRIQTKIPSSLCPNKDTIFSWKKHRIQTKISNFLPENNATNSTHHLCHLSAFPAAMPPVHTIKSEIMHPAQHTCYMALHAQNPTPATGDHWAVIDSGTSKHVLLEHIYLANATEDHTAVAGFSGQTSRATHRGDFTATVRTATGKLIHITDVDSALVIPDAIRTLYSVRKSLQSGNTIRFDANAGLLVQGRPEFFVPFVRDSSTDLFLLPLLVPPTRHNGVYGIYNATTTPHKNPSGINLLKQAQTTAEKSSAQKQYLTDHHRLGHVQQQRFKDINVDGIKKLGKRQLPHTSCPTCIVSKSRKPNRPPATTPTDRAVDGPWQDVYSDMSGKFRITSITGAKYFCVFVCRWSGAKHVEFLSSKDLYFYAFRRFISKIGHFPKVFRTDQGTEIVSHRMTALLEENFVNHKVAAKDQHYAIGVAENAIMTIRQAAKSLLLHANVPRRYWEHAISHAAYLNNITSKSRAEPTKTIYELIFGTKADVTSIPPFGCFASIYKERRQLKDQSLDLTSTPGVFIGISRHNKVLGFILTDGTRVTVTRDKLAFDPQLYPFVISKTKEPAWQTFHKLTTPAASTDKPEQSTVDKDDEPESDFDPDADTTKSLTSRTKALSDVEKSILPSNNVSAPAASIAPDTTENTIPDESSSESDTEEPGASRTLRTRTPKTSIKTTITNPSALRKQATLTRYTTDSDYKRQRDSLLQTEVTRYFPGHGTFKGKITEYYPATDTYSIIYDDNDTEVQSYKDIQSMIPGTDAYAAHQVNMHALSLAFSAAATEAKTAPSYNEPQSYREARAAPDAAQWMAACELEHTKLTKLGCWEVVPRSSIPSHAKVMASRWAFRYKTNEDGLLKTVSHRSRFVAKGFTQRLHEHYFESFSPVVSFVTVRLLFALTALPFFKVLQYDVSVAFIQSKIPDNDPPLYCDPPEGFEDKRKWVYRLLRNLYGMKQSPRAYNHLFAEICRTYGLTQLKSDECVFVTMANNSKSAATQDNTTDIRSIPHMQPTLPEDDRIWPDCPYAKVVLIVCTYVDDNLFFTNSVLLAKHFEAFCKTRIDITCDGPVNWYLSVKYDRDEVTGAVTAHQDLYIDKLLQKWGMADCKPVPAPFPSKTDKLIDELALPVTDVDPVMHKQYQALIGSFLYLQSQHRSHVLSCFSLKRVSKFLFNQVHSLPLQQLSK